MENVFIEFNNYNIAIDIFVKIYDIENYENIIII